VQTFALDGEDDGTPRAPLLTEGRTTMTKASELAWGFKLVAPQDGGPVPAEIEAPALWGARLILNDPHAGRPTVELLFDRQDLQADTEDARAALVKALDGEPKGEGAIKALLAFLTREARHYRIGRESADRFDRTLKGVRFRGSPNASHGYVYVTASLENIPTCDGCGTGGAFKGTAKFPGVCDKCRDEAKADARAEKSAVRERSSAGRGRFYGHGY
jgi:hypothetical protein